MQAGGTGRLYLVKPNNKSAGLPYLHAQQRKQIALAKANQRLSLVELNPTSWEFLSKLIHHFPKINFIPSNIKPTTHLFDTAVRK